MTPTRMRAMPRLCGRRARQGPVPLGPMPRDLAPEAAVLPMKAWARRKSLEDALRLNDLEVSSRDKRNDARMPSND